jgi:hypothetical protein
MIQIKRKGKIKTAHWLQGNGNQALDGTLTEPEKSK